MQFRAFIMRGNVVDSAAGIVIGAAFTGIVNSLVKDVFNPIIGMLTGGVDFSGVFVPLNGGNYANLAAAGALLTGIRDLLQQERRPTRRPA